MRKTYLVKIVCLTLIFLLSPLRSGASFFSATEMVLIPSGAFMMGGELESGQSPVHEVFLDFFYIDVYEVTQEVFKNVMNYNPSKNKGRSLPVEFVDWFEANEYCKKKISGCPVKRSGKNQSEGGLVRNIIGGTRWMGSFPGLRQIHLVEPIRLA